MRPLNKTSAMTITETHLQLGAGLIADFNPLPGSALASAPFDEREIARQQTADQTCASGAPVTVCNSSSVNPSTISRTTSPFGDTSITARSV